MAKKKNNTSEEIKEEKEEIAPEVKKEEIEYDDIEDRDGDSFENRNVSVSSIPNTPDNQGENTEAEVRLGCCS